MNTSKISFHLLINDEHRNTVPRAFEELDIYGPSDEEPPESEH